MIPAGRSALICAVIITEACGSVVADAAANFDVEGTVVASDGRPLGGVDVFFIDTDLEMAPKAKGRRLLVGRSDAAGHVRGVVEHHWSRYLRRDGSERDPGIRPGFALEFVSTGFEPLRQTRALADTKRADRTYMVTFDVRLQRDTRVRR
jgi:hypothetical protein